MTLRRAAGSGTLLLVAIVTALVVAEAAVRLFDGYPLLSLHLGFLPAALRVGLERWSLVPLAAPLTRDPDVDPAWIDDPPPAPATPAAADPELLALKSALRHPEVPEYNLYNVWNARFVDEVACSTMSGLPLLPMPVQVFDPPEPTRHPPYRYLPGRTTPQGFTTNRFGWRGPDLPLDKPPATVRLAFVGASTTVGAPIYPYGYPECVVHWLNRWAERAHLGVRFDGINAGRAGVVSTDIAAIVRQEVLPLEPDLVVYYEGANQFIFADPLTDAGANARRWDKGDPPGTWGRLITPAREYSALARRLDEAVRIVFARGGREPPKPAYQLRWPAGVDEQDPDIGRTDLPLQLPVILADLESIRGVVEGQGGELAVASFVWLAADGLRVDPVRHGSIYSWLNDKCWPYRYADIRRLADFQNRVFVRYAAAHHLLLIDVAGVYPPDPDLFLDAIHFNGYGTRLQAWVVLQALVPLVRERLAAGTWPRPDREPLTRHPNLGPSRPYTIPCAQPSRAAVLRPRAQVWYARPHGRRPGHRDHLLLAGRVP